MEISGYLISKWKVPQLTHLRTMQKLSPLLEERELGMQGK